AGADFPDRAPVADLRADRPDGAAVHVPRSRLLHPRPHPARRRPVPDREGTREIHQDVEGPAHETEPHPGVKFGATVAQIIVIDIVFSIDSIITAVGMAEYLAVMIA